MFSEKKKEISQLTSYLIIIFLMGAKAIGLDEGQKPFYVALLLSIVCFLLKMLSTKWNKVELIAGFLLILLGVLVFFNSRKMDFIFMIVMFISMKNVSLEKVIRIALLIWGSLFIFKIISSLLGLYPGYIGIQRKSFFDIVLVRYSLGYTHPNVLHMTYFIIILMIMYLTKRSQVKWKIYSIILLGNVYIFLYSLSFTGLLTVFLAVLIDFLFSNNTGISFSKKTLSIIIVTLCFLTPTVAAYILPTEAVEIIDKMVNQRCGMTKMVFDSFPPQLLGRSADINSIGLNLDSSYAYMLFYGGYLLFILYGCGYIGCLINSLNNNRYKQAALLLVMAVSGITEQYMGNMSFKNISILLMGNFVLNGVTSRDEEQENGNISFIDIILSRFVRARSYIYENASHYTKKNVVGGIIVSLVAICIFKYNWIEPQHFYLVTDRNDITYIEYSSKADIDIDNNIVMGQLYDGCHIHDVDYAYFRFDTIRGIISSALWGFLVGYTIMIIRSYLISKRIKGDLGHE